ncbi:hypothetical protein [Peribacillus frigoritolerans]|uniref:hypothetical protein n=1 Tax=Peribacillus castrilensis TaxID=2897690 RepID=UPI003DA55464
MKQAIQKIILTLFTAFVEKERDEIKTSQGDCRSKEERGKVRSTSYIYAERLGETLQAGESKRDNCCAVYGIAKPTFYRKVKE